MKLQEAIEIAVQGLPEGNRRLSTQFGKAVKLLIEAGKREMECRKGIPPESWDLLPGETKGE